MQFLTLVCASVSLLITTVAARLDFQCILGQGVRRPLDADCKRTIVGVNGHEIYECGSQGHLEWVPAKQEIRLLPQGNSMFVVIQNCNLSNDLVYPVVFSPKFGASNILMPTNPLKLCANPHFMYVTSVPGAACMEHSM